MSILDQNRAKANEEIIDDEEEIEQSDKSILRMFILSIKKCFKLLKEKLKSKIKFYKKLFIHERYQENLKKISTLKKTKNDIKEIPSVLKKSIDIDNKVNKYREENKEPRIGLNEFEIINKAEAYAQRYTDVQQKLGDISKSSLSASSIKIITNEIIKSHKVLSFIEREIERTQVRLVCGKAV